ncbi:MAG: hypothetical protein QM733_04565 [Ilumatobacteraceae bacterium]
MTQTPKRRRFAAVLSVFVVIVPTALAGPARVSAQAPRPIIPNPSPAAPPGAGFLTDLLSWLKYIALWSSVAALLIGAIAIGVGHFGSNYGAASVGRKWLLGGIGCAVVAALAWTIASTVFNSTS